MSSFFKDLIALGEEESARPAAAQASAARASMTHAELLTELQQVEGVSTARQKEYDELRSESRALQSEYDAFKRKVDQWQRQMKEARNADKKMIQDLRAAGASGRIDDVFVQQTDEKINSLKESLREAHEETERAYKRQREAEQQRAAVEEDRRRELEELTQRFEAYKEAMRQQHATSAAEVEALRAQLGGHGGAGSLRAALDGSERQRRALQTRCQALEEEVSALRRATQNAAVAGDAAQSSGSADGAAEGISTPDRAGGQPATSAPTPSAAATAAALEEELERLQGQLAAAQARENEVAERARRAQDKLARLEEDSKWEALQAEKRLSDARAQAEAWRGKYAMIESRLEARDAEATASERALRKELRATEDSLVREKEVVAEKQRQLDEARGAVDDLRQREREHASRQDAMRGEAEEASRKTQDALDTQRQHFEQRHTQLELQLQRAFSEHQSLEAALQDLREDVRHRDDAIGELRRELSHATAQMADVEEQLAASQRALNEREEDVMVRERERHRVRAQLRQEEEAVAGLRQTNAELQERLAEAEQEQRRCEAAVARSEADAARARGEVSSLVSSQESLRHDLASKDKQLAELTGRLKDLGMRNADVLKLREDQAARVRYYEGRLAELQEELRCASSDTQGGRAAAGAPAAAAQSSSHETPTAGGVGAVGTGHFALPIPRAFATGLTARYKRLSWAQLKMIIAATVFFILVISIVNTYSAASTGKQDVETLELLREKYGQALTAVTVCRESLADAKEKLLACAPSTRTPPVAL